ncbi:9543_t:CDS:2, partial [Racocetra fulgida]
YKKNYYIPFSRLRYDFKLLLRGSRDGFTPQIFHEKCDNQGPNLVVLKIRGDNQVIGDMRRQFNEKDNCSAKKRCYKHTIINATKFAVDDYEVFQ